MDIHRFIKMPATVAAERIQKSGLKKLTKSPGEFYSTFFAWPCDDFKDKLVVLVSNGLMINDPICERWGDLKAPIFHVLAHAETGREQATAIKALVECGADINLTDENGRTPIMLASSSIKWGGGQIDLSKTVVVKTLVSLGADLSLRDHEGNFVTDLADQRSLPFLVNAGAPINVESKTALRTALWAKNLPLALQLLQKGVRQKLSNFDCFYNFAFLETIARTDPYLFRDGFAVVDKGKSEPRETEARKNFEKLLEACSAVPNLSEGGYAILEYSTPENPLQHLKAENMFQMTFSGDVSDGNETVFKIEFAIDIREQIAKQKETDRKLSARILKMSEDDLRLELSDIAYSDSYIYNIITEFISIYINDYVESNDIEDYEFGDLVCINHRYVFDVCGRKFEFGN